MKQPVKKVYDGFAVLPGDPGSRTPGCIKIHEGAVATIVKKNALSVEGVARISGNSLIDNLAEIIGSKKIQDRSISIRFEDTNVAIEISINVTYGFNLQEIAAEIQNRIVSSVQEMTGLTVTNVNVIIREVEDAPPPGKENPE